jgi:hypothetical protein
MPGTWPSYEKLSRMKYHMVMILSLLCKRPWLEGISPAFALICQYLSSTVRDLTLSIFSPRRREILGLHHLQEKNNLWKQLFRWRRLKRISLSDTEKLTQAESCKRDQY